MIRLFLAAALTWMTAVPIARAQDGPSSEVIRLQKVIAELEGKLKERDAQYKSARTQLVDALEKVDQLMKVLEVAEKKVPDAERAKTFGSLVQRAERAEREVKMLNDRNGMLLNRLREALKKNARLEAENPNAGKEPKKPNSPAEGKIIKLDPNDSTIVTIDVGSKSGLRKGATLDLLRTEPRPVYLGTLRVIECRDDASIGRYSPAAAAKNLPLKVGDKVTSSIVGALDP